MKSTASQQKSISTYLLACILFAGAGTIQAATTPSDPDMVAGLPTKTESSVFEVPSLNEIQLICRDDLSRRPRARCFYPSELQKEVEKALAVHTITLEEMDSVPDWRQFKVLCDESNQFDLQLSISSSADLAVRRKYRERAQLETSYGASGATVYCYVPVSWAKSSTLLEGMQGICAYVFITKLLYETADAGGVVRWADACTKLASSFRRIAPSQREVLKGEIQSFVTAYQAASLDEQHMVSDEILMGLMILYVYLQGWSDFSAGEIAQWSNILASVSEQLEFSLWGNVSGEIQQTLDVIKRAVAAGQSGSVATVRREITALESRTLENNTAVLGQVAAVQGRIERAAHEVADLKRHGLSKEIDEYFSPDGLVLSVEDENVGEAEFRALVESGRLARVEALSCKSCSMPVVSKWFLDACPQLRLLHIRGCQLERIEIGSFDDCPELAVVDIRDNNVSWLPERLFDRSAHLTHFDCSENKINRVECTFVGCPELYYMSFAYNNELAELPDDILPGAANVRHCDFGGCSSLRVLPSSVATAPHLSTLFLHGTGVAQATLEAVLGSGEIAVNLCTLPDGAVAAHKKVKKRFSKVIPTTLIRDEIDIATLALAIGAPDQLSPAAAEREWVSALMASNNQCFKEVVRGIDPWTAAQDGATRSLAGKGADQAELLGRWQGDDNTYMTYADACSIALLFCKADDVEGKDADKIQKAIKGLSIAITGVEIGLTILAIVGTAGAGGILVAGGKELGKVAFKAAFKAVFKESLKAGAKLVLKKGAEGLIVGGVIGGGLAAAGVMKNHTSKRTSEEMWGRAAQYSLFLSRLVLSLHAKFKAFLTFCKASRIGEGSSEAFVQAEEIALLREEFLRARSLRLTADDLAVFAQLRKESDDVWSMLSCIEGQRKKWNELFNLNKSLESLLFVFMNRLSMRPRRGAYPIFGEGELVSKTITPKEMEKAFGIEGAVERHELLISDVLKSVCLKLKSLALIDAKSGILAGDGDSGQSYANRCSYAHSGNTGRLASDSFYKLYRLAADLYSHLMGSSLEATGE